MATAWRQSPLAKQPPGARFDVYLAGECRSKVNGALTGCDHINRRADGRVELDIHGELTTTGDNAKIALRITGVAVPDSGEGLFQVRLAVSFMTSVAKYSWLNHVLGWGIGIVNVSTGKLNIKVYSSL